MRSDELVVYSLGVEGVVARNAEIVAIGDDFLVSLLVSRLETREANKVV